MQSPAIPPHRNEAKADAVHAHKQLVFHRIHAGKQYVARKKVVPVNGIATVIKAREENRVQDSPVDDGDVVVESARGRGWEGGWRKSERGIRERGERERESEATEVNRGRSGEEVAKALEMDAVERRQTKAQYEASGGSVYEQRGIQNPELGGAQNPADEYSDKGMKAPLVQPPRAQSFAVFPALYRARATHHPRPQELGPARNARTADRRRGSILLPKHRATRLRGRIKPHHPHRHPHTPGDTKRRICIDATHPAPSLKHCHPRLHALAR
ncbi:hypothetical protein C8R47DRAFT_1192332 [Mycena vitilis]|nr:hypothetical protein C8R47DRAFT_1192332 [Mycena vitilis]